MSTTSGNLTLRKPDWACGRCGEVVGGEVALRDHQEWCLGDAAANRRLMLDVGRQDGGITQEGLVAAAEQFRLAKEGADEFQGPAL